MFTKLDPYFGRAITKQINTYLLNLRVIKLPTSLNGNQINPIGFNNLKKL